MLPAYHWLKKYNKHTLREDLFAALVVCIMLIPQSLAYASLAGLPPQTGLYASILPLMAYALFGSSGPLSVGPFAITSIMTATALAGFAHQYQLSGAQLLPLAALLAFSCGAILLLFGILRLGYFSNFISFPVVTGFISASAVIIAASQFDQVLGVSTESRSFLEHMMQLGAQAQQFNLPLLGFSLSLIALLYFLPKGLTSFFECRLFSQKLSPALVELLVKSSPLLVVCLAALASDIWQLKDMGVRLLGNIPSGLPPFSLPEFLMLGADASEQTLHAWQDLLQSALLISVIGFISSLSAAQTFAARRRERIDPNQEAIALGMANVSASISSAFPVAASLSRSAVSFQAGARTPAAGFFAALGIIISCQFLAPLLAKLPLVSLSAMILLAVTSLVNISGIVHAWRFSKKDFAALALTFLLTLLVGLEWGLIAGISLSIILHLYRTSRPHIAILGQIPDTEHFRNIERHQVITHEKVLSLRVDASLYFANARFLLDQVNGLLASYSQARHLVLNCSAVNDIDISALESLMVINQQLEKAGVCFHLAEVKGPVMDKLKRCDFIDQLSGNIYLSHHKAIQSLQQASKENNAYQNEYDI